MNLTSVLTHGLAQLGSPDYMPIAIPIACAILSLALTYYSFYANSKSSRIELSRILIYPVKGCAPIEAKEWRINRLGFEFDRQFMLTSKPSNPAAILPSTYSPSSPDKSIESNERVFARFRSQREHPKLCLIQPSLDFANNLLILSAPSMPILKIPVKPPSDSPLIWVKIWDDQVLASIYDNKLIENWFTEYLNESCFFVSIIQGNIEIHNRKINSLYDISDFNKTKRFHSSFTDGYPFLLASESSLNQLNKEVESKRNIDMIAFRPNLVIKGINNEIDLPPYEEDLWRTFTIKPIDSHLNSSSSLPPPLMIFHSVKPSERCSVPCTILDKGIKDPENQPTRTLRLTRELTKNPENSTVYFGVNCVCSNSEGWVRVGSRVEVIERKRAGAFVETRQDWLRDGKLPRVSPD